MFDVGFGEILVIATIAVIVVGPDKLPEVVRTTMRYVRKAKRMFNDVKNDVERELELDELRKYINENEVSQSIKELKTEIQDVSNEGKSILSDMRDDAQNSKRVIDDIDKEVRESLEKKTKIDSEPKTIVTSEKNKNKAEIETIDDGEAFKDTGVEKIKDERDESQHG